MVGLKYENMHNRQKNTHIGVYTSNRVRKHGIEESVSMQHERKEIGECKDGREQTRLDCATNKTIDNRVCLTEAST